MQKSIITLILISIAAKIHAGGIIEIYSMREAQDILDRADERTLVLYDVDETLIAPTDKIHLPHYFKVDPARSLKIEFEKRVGDRIEYVWSKVLLQARRELIEPNIVRIIADFQARGVMTLGLTKMRSESFGIIDSLAEYRFNQLYKLGIDFRLSYAHRIEFKQFVSQYGTHPILYNGIIMTGDLSKGPILRAFIDCLDCPPALVIIFDDALENCIDMYEAMCERGIECHAYHYRAAELVSGELDCAVAQFQLDYLYEHEVWLSEEEARAHLTTTAASQAPSHPSEHLQAM